MAESMPENLSSLNPITKRPRVLYFLLFLACGLIVFLVSITFSPLIPENAELALRSGLCVLFLAGAFFFRRSRGPWQKYWAVSFAFFIAAATQFLAWQFSGWPLRWFHLDTATPQGLAVAKLSQSLLIIVPIIILTLLSGHNLASIYLQKGKIRYGLTVGLVGFSAFAFYLIFQANKSSLGLPGLLSWAPWILIFVLSNGLNEELLFRGLFLKKFEPFLGRFTSNFLIAIVFTLSHMKVEYVTSGEMLNFLAVVFLLALAWGYVMQRTDALWGSALFHAGSDLLLFSGMFNLL